MDLLAYISFGWDYEKMRAFKMEKVVRMERAFKMERVFRMERRSEWKGR